MENGRSRRSRAPTYGREPEGREDGERGLTSAGGAYCHFGSLLLLPLSRLKCQLATGSDGGGGGGGGGRATYFPKKEESAVLPIPGFISANKGWMIALGRRQGGFLGFKSASVGTGREVEGYRYG